MSGISPNTAGAHLSNRQRVFAILKASSGNLLEWSGFYFYVYCMIYCAPSFFPSEDPTMRLLQSAGIFAFGSIARPIGGWFYGRLADRQGRRAALIHSGCVMFAGSLLLAVIPSYATIGYAAPALLLLARLLQGLSVGGDYGTSATYMSEVALKNQRGFLGSFQYATLIGGQLIALSTMILLEALFTKAQLTEWGWRIPFVLGALGSLLSVALRFSLQESATPKGKTQTTSSLRGLLEHKRALLTIFVTTAAGSVCFYTFTVYMQKYLVNSLGLATTAANTVLGCALAVCICLQPLLGALSDRIGRTAPMLLFSGLMALSTIPIVYLLTNTTNIYAIFGLMTLALTVLSFYTSISGLIKAELFPPQIRALGVGFSYAIANAIFGGSAEYVAFWMKAMDVEFLFYIYVSVLCLLSLVVCAWNLPSLLKTDYLEHKQAA